MCINAHTQPLYKTLKIMTLGMMHRAQIYEYTHNHTPTSLTNTFSANHNIHNHNTRHRNDPHIESRNTIQYNTIQYNTILFICQ